MLSSRREGVPELDREGEAYDSRRFRVGVVGGAEDVDARTGDGARWTGVVTSECNTDVKMELACSGAGSKSVQVVDRKCRNRLNEDQRGKGTVPLRASDSVGINLPLDGVDGPPSSLRW